VALGLRVNVGDLDLAGYLDLGASGFKTGAVLLARIFGGAPFKKAYWEESVGGGRQRYTMLQHEY